MSIKKIRIITSGLSLVVMVVLAILVLRLTRFQDNYTRPIQWETLKEQVNQKSSMAVKRPQGKLIIPEQRKKSSLPIPVDVKPGKVSLPLVEKPSQLQAMETKGENDLLEENIPDMLAWAIQKEFPELDLSVNEIKDLAETMRNIREAREGLADVGKSKENVDSIMQKRDHMVKASEQFKRITGSTIVDFLLRVSGQVGIDNNNPNDEEIDSEYTADPQ